MVHWSKSVVSGENFCGMRTREAFGLRGGLLAIYRSCSRFQPPAMFDSGNKLHAHEQARTANPSRFAAHTYALRRMNSTGRSLRRFPLRTGTDSRSGGRVKMRPCAFSVLVLPSQPCSETLALLDRRQGRCSTVGNLAKVIDQKPVQELAKFSGLAVA